MKRFFLKPMPMKYRVLALFLLGPLSVLSQDPNPPAENAFYREDQFYLGLSYNLLLDLPEGVSQSNLPYGLQAGFIRDIPLNPGGTIALGVGLGYGVNSYYTNLRALQEEDGIRYEVLPAGSEYRRNKVETHIIELPLEFRWRNSTPVDYKFWRIYGGLKLGYVVGSRSKFVTRDFIDSFYNTDTRNFRYGIQLNVGYNTFNLHIYYGLNDLFEDGVAGPDNAPLGMRPLHLGLMFYIL